MNWNPRKAKPRQLNIGRQSESELLDLHAKANSGARLDDEQHLAAGAVEAIADGRHAGKIRMQLAQKLGVNIDGLTPLRAACRILAKRCESCVKTRRVERGET